MPLNYLMIPENIQRRPLPGHRHRPKKVKKVVETSETFSPYSRAGRRVPGEVTVETTMVKSAKMTEERGDLALFKHIKKLDKILAARRLSAAPRSEDAEEEMEVETVHDVTATKEEHVSESVAPQCSQKRPLAESVETSSIDVVGMRVVKRARYNAVASSSRARIEDAPQSSSIVCSTARSRSVLRPVPQKRTLTESAATSSIENVDVRVVKRARFNSIANSSRVRIEDVPQRPCITLSTARSGSTVSQLPQKRPLTESGETVSIDDVDTRVVKRARLRARIEDTLQPPSITNSTDDSLDLAGDAGSACSYDRACQGRAGEHFHIHVVNATDAVEQYPPFLAHAVHHDAVPAFPDLPAAHQIDIQPSFPLPVHEEPNSPVEPFWLNIGQTVELPLHNSLDAHNSDDLELDSEHVAVACAWAAIGKNLTEIETEEIPFNFINGYVDLNLERLAVACAYAGMGEPIATMDTLLDDTRSTVFDFVPREPPVFDQAGFPHPQGTQFEHDAMFQPPQFVQHVPRQPAQFEHDMMFPQIYQPVRYHEYEGFADEDQRLRPPMDGYQPFHQGYLVPDPMIPPHLSAHANDDLFKRDHFAAVSPFDVDGNHTFVHALSPLQPMIQDEPVNREFDLYPPIHEEVINQRNIRAGNQNVGESVDHDMNFPQMYQSGQHQEYEYYVDEDQRLRPPTDEYRVVHFGNKWFLVNAEGREPDPAELLAFEALFGAEGRR